MMRPSLIGTTLDGSREKPAATPPLVTVPDEALGAGYRSLNDRVSAKGRPSS